MNLKDEMYFENLGLPGPPKEPNIMAQYPKIESIGSIGSIVLAILEVQVSLSSGVSALGRRPRVRVPNISS